MTQARRIGTTTSKTRARLLDVTESIMLEEGYAAVSSRSVAARADVKAPLVHYYFPTLDDLFVAVFRRRSERSIERLTADLEAGPPLRVIWEYASNQTGNALTAEFVALANHRKAIQAEIAEVALRLRRIQTAALKDALDQYGVDTDRFPPVAVVVLMAAIPRVMVSEDSLGMSTGHPEVRALVEHYLDLYEPKP